MSVKDLHVHFNEFLPFNKFDPSVENNFVTPKKDNSHQRSISSISNHQYLGKYNQEENLSKLKTQSTLSKEEEANRSPLKVKVSTAKDLNSIFFEEKKKEPQKDEDNSRSKKVNKKSVIKSKTSKDLVQKIDESQNECSDFNKNIKYINSKNWDNDFQSVYLNIPIKLQSSLLDYELNVISPQINISGQYSYYINDVANSIKNFIDHDYDSIFSNINKSKVSYHSYTPTEGKKLLLLDLDETLVHCEFKNNIKMLNHKKHKKRHSKLDIKTFSYCDENYRYYVDCNFRPNLKDFLEEVSKYYDIGIFTAACKNYANMILDEIDPENKYFMFRLYRHACIPIQDKLYIKDLRIIKNIDLSKTVLMDNSLYSFINQPSNGMLVNSFYDDPEDVQLISAKNYLIQFVSKANDVREENEKWFKFTKLLYKGTSKGKNLKIKNKNN